MAKMKLILGVVIIVLSLSACGSTAEQAGGMSSSQPGQEMSSEAEKAEQEASPQEGRETPKENQETPEEGREAPKENQETPEEGQEMPKEEQETPEEGRETPKTAGNFRCQDYAVTIPDNWGDKYIVFYQNCGELDSGIGFYASLCFEETGTGWLFSLAKYHDDSYKEQPCYEVIAETAGVTYVAVYPTDVQCVGVSKEAQEEYGVLSKSVDSVIASFTPVRDS